jgi:autocrine motility factor receptor
MFAESIGLTLRTIYIITRYTVHLLDLHNLAQWNNKGTITYYIDFIFEMTVISIDFFHYLHMLIYGNFYLSMASLVICMELKRLFFDLKKRMKRHSNYLKVIEKMEKRFPWATKEQLESTDKCAVCWDPLDQARRLPCSHLFHHNCLRSWLEQDTSCPTCRKSLQDEKPDQFSSSARNMASQSQQQQQQQQQQPMQQQQNQVPTDPLQGEAQARNPMGLQRNLFHFDGSRYISWLPSFSLQVTNSGNLLPSLLRSRLAAAAPPPPLDPTRLNAMTQQVSQLFPHLTLDQIEHDLRQTHSVEATIENILEDRLLTGQQQQQALSRQRNQNQSMASSFLNDLDVNDVNLNAIGADANHDSDMDMDEDEDEDDDDDEEEEEDTESYTTEQSEDVNTNNNNNNNNLNSNANASNLIESLTSSVRQRSSLFSLFSNNRVQSNANNSGSLTATSTTSILTDPSQVSVPDDSAIISKYSPSPNLSENANNLIQRKRDLILNSKRRFLQKTSQSSHPESTNNKGS